MSSKSLQETASTTPAVVTPADQFLSTIQASASDPQVDITKMERLYEMYKDVRAQEAKQAYNAAMVEAQKEMPAIEKLHLNNQTNSYYAKQEDVIRAIKPVWTANGFSLSFYPAPEAPDGFVTVMCDVSHIGGDVRTFSYPSPIVNCGIQGKVNMTDTHARASAVTYGERYLTGMIFCLEATVKGQDDDGNASGGTITPRITEEQVLEVNAKITDNDLDMGKFKNWLRKAIKADSIEDIAVTSLPAVLQQIDQSIKLRKKKEAKA